MRILAAIKKNLEFDPGTFLATIGGGRKILSVAKKETIFAQGPYQARRCDRRPER